MKYRFLWYQITLVCVNVLVWYIQGWWGIWRCWWVGGGRGGRGGWTRLRMSTNSRSWAVSSLAVSDWSVVTISGLWLVTRLSRLSSALMSPSSSKSIRPFISTCFPSLASCGSMSIWFSASVSGTSKIPNNNSLALSDFHSVYLGLCQCQCRHTDAC